MTPPPNNPPSNSDDPFGGLDPMAWLESLARRQGANPDELTTAADLDVPIPPPDSVISEPGYTPYDTGSSKPQAAPPPPTPEPVAAEPAPSDDPFGGMDPMAWLELLAKRQGANVDELTTAADLDVPMPAEDTQVTGPGYTPGYDVGSTYKASAPPTPKGPETVRVPAMTTEPAPPPPPPTTPMPPLPIAQPVASDAGDDPLGGLDPMAWLESLAKRQGANPDELTTSADLDVPTVSPDTVIDEPGYTPGYDVGTRSAAQAEPAPRSPETLPVQPLAAEPPARRPAAPEAWPEPGTMQPAASQPVAAGDDPTGGLDPLAWMEALAVRQHVNPDELITGGTAEIPPAPIGAIIDEPGYTDYSAFGQAPLSEAIETPSMSQAEAEHLLGLSATGKPMEANPLEEMDPIKWLETLASSEVTSPDDLTSFASPAAEASDTMGAESALSWLEQLANESSDAEPLQMGESYSEGAPVNELGGLSDDPDEILKWLVEQGTGLAEVHDQIEDSATFDDEFKPLEPGELPDWLKGQLGAPQSSPTTAFNEDIVLPPIPADLPQWLMPESESSSSSALTADLEKMLSGDDSSSGEMETPTELSTGEIDALVLPASPDQIDPWAEALDEEYDRRLAGDVSIPGWYQEALERNGEFLEEVEVEPAVPQGDVLAPDANPDWFAGLTNETDDEPDAIGVAATQDIPAWLLDANPGLSLSAPPSDEVAVPAEEGLADLDNWLADGTDESSSQVDWLPPMQAAPPTEPVVLPPVPAAPPPPVQPPVRESAQPPYAPNVDLDSSFATARELIASNRHMDSLGHFEPLIDASHNLGEVIESLKQVVTAQPRAPRARRLLGDAYMRQGNLQDALDTYRSALDQL